MRLPGGEWKQGRAAKRLRAASQGGGGSNPVGRTMTEKKRSGWIRDLFRGLLVGLIDEEEGVEDATHVSGLRNWGTGVP